MSKFTPMRELPDRSQYKSGRDVLVVFGEIFSRGYANGIVDEATHAGLKVIRSTVGRRNSDGALRALNQDEISLQPKPLINVPLEAGFDFEPCEQDCSTPVEQLQGIKLSEWETCKLDWRKIKSSEERGAARFRAATQNYLKELETLLKDDLDRGINLIFAHTMAGGVPRTKIVMPLMNRVFKGRGERHLSSEKFWQSDIGKLAALNFTAVTADTLRSLIELSASLRNRIEAGGGSVRYLAYGYHGTEVLINGETTWQSYAPYLQGWAKLELETVAREAQAKGIKATVYNCPEILTNSSSIFVGVEVPLYPFVQMLEKSGTERARLLLARARELLKPEVSLKDLTQITDRALSSPEIRKQSQFIGWPQHNTPEQMETLIAASEALIGLHRDEKNLLTFILSEEIFRATGYLMFHDSWKAPNSVVWLGHDVLAKALASGQTL